MDIGNKIKKARLEIGLSQKEIVKKYNILSQKISNNSKNFKTITNSTLSNWEKNIYQPDPDSIAILCSILNINANYLLDIDKLENNLFSKKIFLENNNIVEIHTEKPWEELSEENKKEIMDSIIEESIKIKKESNKKEKN